MCRMQYDIMCMCPMQYDIMCMCRYAYSGIQNVKSREDLVMLENGGIPVDPFSAAPFNPKNKGQCRRLSVVY